MAKAAAVKVDNMPVVKAGVPSGIRIADGIEVSLDAASIRKVMEGWEVKRILEDARERLEAINAALIAAHGTGCALVVCGLCRASLAEREAVKVTDAERLRAVLGERFNDLTKVDVSFKPEPKLIEMAADGDEPLQPAIAACLTVGKSRSVTWRAEK